MACDFTALVQSGNYSVVTLPAQPGNYSVTAFPAQPGDYSCCKQHDLRPSRCSQRRTASTLPQ